MCMTSLAKGIMFEDAVVERIIKSSAGVSFVAHGTADSLYDSDNINV